MLGCVLLVFRQNLSVHTNVPAMYAWLVLVVSAAFVFERSKTIQVWRKAMVAADDADFTVPETPPLTRKTAMENGGVAQSTAKQRKKGE